MVTETGDTAAFCGYDPWWAKLALLLTGRFNKEYGGITVFGRCPRCEHEDGINVFIPTTWATTTAITASGSPTVHAAALVHPSAIEAEAEVQWYRVQWQPPGTTAAGLGAQQQESAIETEADVQWQPSGTTAAGSEAQQREIVEVIVCRCGLDFKHKPPSGKAGCGYWAYLRLQKETIPDGD